MYYRLLHALLKYGDLENVSILLNDGKLGEEIRKLGIPIIVVDEKQMNFYQLVRKIKKIVRNLSPDVIHSHRRKENMLAYLSSKQDNRIPLVCTQHGMSEPLMSNFKMIKNDFLLRCNHHVLSRYFKYVIAVSKDIRNILIDQYGYNNEKVLLIHNGTYIPDNILSKSDQNTFVIGSAGRLFAVKNYALMVETAREIHRETDRVRFVLAGNGPEKENILQMIRKYGIENSFVLKGFIENMETFYEGLDVYINTSLHEGLPMTILEAMAHGLPVIAPKVGGIPEILNNQLSECMVEGRDPKTFAAKCLEFYENRDLVRKMGGASRERIISEFSVETMGKKYYECYWNIVE